MLNVNRWMWMRFVECECDLLNINIICWMWVYAVEYCTVSLTIPVIYGNIYIWNFTRNIRIFTVYWRKPWHSYFVIIGTTAIWCNTVNKGTLENLRRNIPLHALSLHQSDCRWHPFFRGVRHAGNLVRFPQKSEEIKSEIRKSATEIRKCTRFA